MNKTATATSDPPTILEIWHGGIPTGKARMPLCSAPECSQTGAHSHTQHISDKPWSIPWMSYVKYHMVAKPALIVHRVGGGSRSVARHSSGWGT